METVQFFDEESNTYIDFYVLEQTRISNVDYLLVTVDETGDTDALILKDISQSQDADALYEIVEEEAELNAVAKVFSELIGDEASLEF
ncbi:MAG: DUF1292 domain-containing protein [Lachnospiraceae bacterium]|nr:DUF1292 domain-containing protein [Lachnospiraceae bacterium]MDD6182352.1 DUF1292 domain-containing protein [Lachnospiraceae bacterium]MDD7379460.1 DUF1292 domain-containing protein [Lachnospiraceae bacterium]MDY4617315.1 DUF1292 domain-containing protein [Lachnospiraceae bacterium]MDY5774207.1 DUF1292 domain-containing protein [Lachnospiraceae bacterium]